MHLKEIHGFTLIELLVTIGILVILVGILLPTIASSKQQARQSECQNNLRRIGLAFHTYASVNEDFFPHEDAGSSGKFPEKSCWFDLLDPYLAQSGSKSIKQCTTFTGESKWHSYKMNSKLESASDPFYQLGSSGDPTNTVLLFDARTDNRGTKYSTKGTWFSGETRHKDKSMVLFVDGNTSPHKPIIRDRGGWSEPGPYIWDWR